MSDTVTVIRFNEDGDPPIVEQITKDTLRSRLRDEYYGRNLRFAQPGTAVRVDGATFVGLVVIDGRIIAPRPVQFATDWEI